MYVERPAEALGVTTLAPSDVVREKLRRSLSTARPPLVHGKASVCQTVAVPVAIRNFPTLGRKLGEHYAHDGFM